MWTSISNAITNLGPRKDAVNQSQSLQEFSDDDICSNASTEEGLECPICWESFNIVENVPYVLWCGHTLCKNCLLGLKRAALKFSTQQIQIPFFISCPWCNLLTIRLLYRGNLKFPSKNFFLLWMVESRNGDRLKSPSSILRDHQVWSPRSTSVCGNQCGNMSHRRAYRPGPLGRNGDGCNTNTISNVGPGRPHFSLHKSLDFFIRLTSKFPLVILLVLLVICVIPTSATILLLYLLITLIIALPSFLVLYFAFPTLDWLVKEITS